MRYLSTIRRREGGLNNMDNDKLTTYFIYALSNVYILKVKRVIPSGIDNGLFFRIGYNCVSITRNGKEIQSLRVHGDYIIEEH